MYLALEHISKLKQRYIQVQFYVIDLYTRVPNLQWVHKTPFINISKLMV